MKEEENETSPKDEEKLKECTSKTESPQPGSSKDCISFQNSPESSDAQSKDALFEPTVDMLVNDFDEEQTLEEEEALAAKEHVDPTEELSDLQRESEMPIEELLKLYGCAPQAFNSNSSASRKRRRRREQLSPAKISKVDDEALKENLKSAETISTSSTVVDPPVNIQNEENAEDSAEEDGTTTATTNTTNYIENQSLDDETNYDDEEPSELKKLYTGLYENNELKLLADDEDDLDYIPDEEDGRKTIMVGSDYQAVIPDSVKYDDALPYENEDKLLWDPSKVKDDDIEDYLFKFSTAVNGATNHTSSQSTETKHLRDDEQALLLLVQCGNNFEEALRRRRLGVAVPTNTMSIWSEEECRNFESGLRLYGKSFHEIQASKVTTRSVGELVEFYYLWKKTDRADLFASKARLEKKKYNINPCVTDLMEKYLEEYDNSGTNRERERDRSVSPNLNSNSMLSADSKRHHRETSSGIANNNHNQHSPDKLKLMKQIDEGAAIKTE
ncbi:hypothetical protein PVAND_003196 [Polypedilum vanderplanki]|uniref:Mesoderm induction early response protein 1 n=1 Tax=Polypedilum vanderplanki TaxID=319348 RepID=A0A9J6BTR1_POLVA|nr:hypothetical protein PVAND_003196 [Polypedilum vanderplanki]